MRVGKIIIDRDPILSVPRRGLEVVLKIVLLIIFFLRCMINWMTFEGIKFVYEVIFVERLVPTTKELESRENKTLSHYLLQTEGNGELIIPY